MAIKVRKVTLQWINWHCDVDGCNGKLKAVDMSEKTRVLMYGSRDYPNICDTCNTSYSARCTFPLYERDAPANVEEFANSLKVRRVNN